MKYQLLIFFATIVLVRPDDYTVTHERINLTYQNPQYLEARIALFKFNRTTKAFNVTMKIKRDLTTDLKLKIQAFRFESNEYRLFPLGFTIDVCDAHINNSFGSRDLKLQLSDCPFKKHTFRLHNYIPDQSRLPPRMVTGSYKVNSQLLDKRVRIMELDWYGAIEPILHLKYSS